MREVWDWGCAGLGGTGCELLPPELGKPSTPLPPCPFPLLAVCSLHSNALPELPPELGRHTECVRLSLYQNKLTTLPPEIGDMVALQVQVLVLVVPGFGGEVPSLLQPKPHQLEKRTYCSQPTIAVPANRSEAQQVQFSSPACLPALRCSHPCRRSHPCGPE